METYNLAELEKAIVIAAKEFCNTETDARELESAHLISFSNQLCIERKVEEWIEKAKKEI